MKFGIIGYGVMGKIRHKVIDSMENHSVVKICDPNAHGLPRNIENVEDYKSIMRDPDIGAVIICVPNYLIRDYVVEALHNKKHVFCEKPPGINASQVLDMIAAEKQNSELKLMFGFNHRHHESVIHAKKLLDSGRYGPLLWMRGRYGKSVPADFDKSWRSKKEFSGGGIFIDQGIHMLDLFLYFGGDFNEIKADVSNLYWHSDIEDNVFAIFKNKNTGVAASLHSTMTQWRHLFSLEMFLGKGYITINGLLTNSGSYGEEQMTVAENRTAAPAAVWTSEEKTTYKINSCWETEMKIFFESIENNTPVPTANSQDALKLMKIVDEVYAQK
jgi:1,5-anhydro-D-fructose reductase (1,5-anhydro-D-mannitol-forming)